MDVHPDRPPELPCCFCGSSVPISWEYYQFLDVWLGTGKVCCGFVIESYQSDSGLPFELLELLGAGAGAGAGAGRELATATPAAGSRHRSLD